MELIRKTSEKMKFAAAVSLIYLTIIVGPGASLDCYECNSVHKTNIRNKKTCVDPFSKDDSLLLKCSRFAHGCIKIEEYVKINNNDFEVKTKRSCATFEAYKSMEADLYENEVIEFCDTDGCNDSQSLEPSAILMICSALMAKLLFYTYWLR